MSIPIIEYVARNIEDSINVITTGNGFNQTLTAIRPKRSDFKDVPPEDLLVLIAQGDEESPEKQPIGAKDWIVPFSLGAFIIDSDNATDSIDIRINTIKADIQKKLLEDHKRGDYAVDTILKPSTYFNDGKGFSGISVEIDILVRVKEDDPYTKA